MLVRLTAPAIPVLSRTVRRILAHNGLHCRIAAQKPVLNKRQLRNRVACAKAHSLTEGWTSENLIFQMNRQLSSIPSASNIVEDPQGHIWTQGSPRRQSNLEHTKVSKPFHSLPLIGAKSMQPATEQTKGNCTYKECIVVTVKLFKIILCEQANARSRVITITYFNTY